jgi:hypothetical protein
MPNFRRIVRILDLVPSTDVCFQVIAGKGAATLRQLPYLLLPVRVRVTKVSFPRLRPPHII